MTTGSAEVSRSTNFGRGGHRLVQWLSRLNWSNFGLIAAILLMSIVFAVLNPNFYSETNLRNVARQTSILGIAACGQTIVILSGGFDLSVGMVIGLVSVVASTAMADYGLWPGIFVGLGMGLMTGGLNGLLVAKAGLPPFIATLAMFSVARGFALIISGGLPITDLPPELHVSRSRPTFYNSGAGPDRCARIYFLSSADETDAIWPIRLRNWRQ